MHYSREYKVKFQYQKHPEYTRQSLIETQTGIGVTSRISYHSAYSKPSSTCSTSIKRINQINPKPPITINSNRQSLASKSSKNKKDILQTFKPPQKPNSQGNRQQRNNKIETNQSQTSELGENMFQSNRSMNYKSNIKPILGIQKYMVLCGMEKGHSANGCSCYAPCKWKKSWTSNYQPKNNKLYLNLLKETPEKVNLDQIGKDIHRTFPDCPTFSRNQQFSNKLREVLTVYSVYDPQVGYAQGMNMVAAVLLYHIKQSEQTFWALVDLMDDKELRMIYIEQFKHLKQHCANLNKLLRQKINDLWEHIHEVVFITPDVFFYGWLLSLMSSCIPLQYMHLVIDKFRTSGWKFMYQLIITYLVFLKQRLLMSEDSSEFLMAVNCESSKQIGLHWQQMLQNCYKVEV